MAKFIRRLVVRRDPAPAPQPVPAPAPQPAPDYTWLIIIGIIGLLFFSQQDGCTIFGPISDKAPFVTTLPVAAAIFIDGTPAGIQKMGNEHRGVLKVYEDFVAAHNGEFRLLDVNATVKPDDDPWVMEAWDRYATDAKTKAPVVGVATPSSGIPVGPMPATPDEAKKQLDALGLK